MRRAAMPALSATSGVSLAVLVRPLMPSVPKYLRVIWEGSCQWSVITTNWLLEVNTAVRQLIRLPYIFQDLKPISQGPGGMGADIVRALGLGEELGRQAGGPGLERRAGHQFAQEAPSGQPDQQRQAPTGFYLPPAAPHEPGNFRALSPALAH